MDIEVGRVPTATGNYRYDVRHRSRHTHGFRATQQAARDAAREDGELLHQCAAFEAQARDAEEEKAKRG